VTKKTKKRTRVKRARLLKVEKHPTEPDVIVVTSEQEIENAPELPAEPIPVEPIPLDIPLDYEEEQLSGWQKFCRALGW
jgi:hypothetical protein